ncbi:MAG: double-cubane-cluster-containing anaerobic reductase [Candidatus Thiodiazotropha sp.]
MNSPNINTEPCAFQHTRQAREAEQTLDQITDRFDDNPKAMDYFYDLFRRVYCQGQALQREGTLVGTTCIHAPEELIYAVGAQPLRLCNGSYHFDQAGGDFMPAKSCSLVKATLGVLSTDDAIPGGGRPELVVNPTTCDQKKKASAMVAEMGYNVYDLELPPGKESEEARLYWQRSVRDFSVRLSKLTGKKLTRSRLKAAMAKTARAQLAFRTLHNLRKNSPALFLGKDAFLVTNAYFFDDIDRWTEAVEQLNEELRAREASGYQAAQRKAPRILFTGSPPIFPNLKLPLLIEEAGGVVVADETCSANRMLYDMSAVDEWRLHDMVDALADRHLKPCTCPIFTNNLDRRRRLLDLAESFNADGVVYQTFAGCQVYEMEQRSVAKTLSEKGIPMLYVETDYSPDDMGQLSTRIEAFLESIKTRKRKRS